MNDDRSSPAPAESTGRPATDPLSLGATQVGDGRWRFRVWAPRAERVELHLFGEDERLVAMETKERGYFEIVLEGVASGSLYKYRLDGLQEFPDPASRSQPQGVHGPSQVFADGFDWTDHHWFGRPLAGYVIYELHVGTYSADGTFEAVIPHLDGLVELGVTAIEVMPVAQFPGDCNWGYDGVHPFAAQNSYGGPVGFKRLVNACHERKLAVVLDVVYNHLGPEGNYLGRFGHYFTDRYRTPWGKAINFDGPHSDEVRRYFVENALQWISEFHVDALRLDAVHAIYDESAYKFLHELADCVHQRAGELNRRNYVFAETNQNDSRLVRPAELGGYALDSAWSDDFHHSLHTLFTDERIGYYEDFQGFEDLVTAYRDGFVYAGQYSSYRKRRHGNSSRELPREKFVVCAQNHDQVGNRLYGERLNELTSFEQSKLAAGAVLLSPFIPLLFMGEEYGETARFQYFISHTDPDLVEAVRRGRREEFAAFQWDEPPPDPQDRATFQRCKLNHSLKDDGSHRALREYYCELLRLRRSEPALACLDKDCIDVSSLPRNRVMAVRRWSHSQEVLAVFHCGDRQVEVSIRAPTGVWSKRLDSAEERWHGPGSPLSERVNSDGHAVCTLAAHSVALFVKER